jgi:hypothetical protein
MDGGIDLGIGCFEKLPVVCSSEFDPYRSKVAEEMLLCEVIVQYRICLQKVLLMRVLCSRTARSFFLWRGSCRQTASIFKRLFRMICDCMSKQGMVDESIAF